MDARETVIISPQNPNLLGVQRVQELRSMCSYE